ncbi:MAG: PCRF domain-containing protein, partial [Muribaculaceae bacterium]|nr:PCRF domain-containing protein [Muribaculaceae bacterium]
MDQDNQLLKRLDGIEARYEETATLITDPDVIADQNRYRKLTKEYKDLGRIVDATGRYRRAIADMAEAREIISSND